MFLIFHIVTPNCFVNCASVLLSIVNVRCLFFCDGYLIISEMISAINDLGDLSAFNHQTLKYLITFPWFLDDYLRVVRSWNNSDWNWLINNGLNFSFVYCDTSLLLLCMNIWLLFCSIVIMNDRLYESRYIVCMRLSHGGESVGNSPISSFHKRRTRECNRSRE